MTAHSHLGDLAIAPGTGAVMHKWVEYGGGETELPTNQEYREVGSFTITAGRIAETWLLKGVAIFRGKEAADTVVRARIRNYSLETEVAVAWGDRRYYNVGVPGLIGWLTINAQGRVVIPANTTYGFIFESQMGVAGAAAAVAYGGGGNHNNMVALRVV